MHLTQEKKYFCLSGDKICSRYASWPIVNSTEMGDLKNRKGRIALWHLFHFSNFLYQVV